MEKGFRFLTNWGAVHLHPVAVLLPEGVGCDSRYACDRSDVNKSGDYRHTVDALLPDCDHYRKRIKELEEKLSPQMRDRILAALEVGKQSPQYKRVKVVLDRFINEGKRDG